MDSGSFYNRLNINPPPVLSYKILSECPEVAKKLKTIIASALGTLKNQNCLHHEAALVSRFIYKFKNRLRNERGFKSMEMVNRGLLQYLAMDIVSIFETTQRQIVDDFGPTRQLLEWLLIRLQGFCKLFDFIHNRSVEAVSYLRWRFQSGHVWSYSLVAIGIISRIWAISQSLVKDCCKWYNSLVNYLPILQPSMTPWLPDNYVLPRNLEEWLGYPSYIKGQKSKTSKGASSSHSIPVNSLEETRLDDRETETENRSNLLSTDAGRTAEDLGVAISREKFDEGTIKIEKKIETKNKKKKRKPSLVSPNGVQDKIKMNETSKVPKKSTMIKCQSFKTSNLSNNSVEKTSNANPIELVKTKAKLLKFIKKETELRKKLSGRELKLSDCVTRNQDALEWKMMKQYIKGRIIEEINNHPEKSKCVVKEIVKQIKLWTS